MDENTEIVVEEAASATSGEVDFDRLLQEVYISPIRSVLVVDDEFPSLDGLLESTISHQTPSESLSAIELLQGILVHCRTRAEPWLVDVHDARRIDWSTEASIATHLHHSDLMILDYHLRGESGGGDAAIGVLRRLASNSHFNIVVIYTKGYQRDIQSVFYELVSAFADRNYVLLSEDKSRVTALLVDELLEKAGLELAELDGHFTYQVYLSLRYQRPGTDVPGSPIGYLQKLIQAFKIPSLRFEDLLAWLMQRAHDRFVGFLTGGETQRLAFNFDANENLNWIKLDSLFITVINKQYEPSQIEPSLLAALRSSDPSPHQLMMAKMRAHMDERGVVAESEILNDLHMQAGWLQELLNAPVADRALMIRSSMDKHWEALGDKLRVDIDRFAHSLLGRLDDVPKKLMKRYFGEVANQGQEVLARLNAYNNSKPVQASHLMTGHVLRFSLEDVHTYWVCLSPACDLVPGQKITGWRTRLGEFMPFAAVRLDSVKLATALRKASENINIFLSLDKGVEAFSFCPEGNPSASPVWEQMFASAGGKFNPADHKLSVTRLHVPKTEGGEEVRSEVSEVTVVAQLRYEYALNLLQRLGSNLSRVGLDYQIT